MGWGKKLPADEGETGLNILPQNENYFDEFTLFMVTYMRFKLIYKMFKNLIE